MKTSGRSVEAGHDFLPHRPLSEQHVARALAVRPQEQKHEPDDERGVEEGERGDEERGPRALRRLEAHAEAGHEREDDDLRREARAEDHLRQGAEALPRQMRGGASTVIDTGSSMTFDCTRRRQPASEAGHRCQRDDGQNRTM